MMGHTARKERKRINKLFPELKVPYAGKKPKTPTPLEQRRSVPKGASRMIWQDRAGQIIVETVAAKPKRTRKTKSQKLAEELSGEFTER